LQRENPRQARGGAAGLRESLEPERRTIRLFPKRAGMTTIETRAELEHELDPLRAAQRRQLDRHQPFGGQAVGQ
jgi:hypothetical protein